MAEKKQSLEHPPSLITSLPDEIIVDIVARVPRCDYPAISLVSKSFRSLVASPELYTRRSLLGCTEHCLYAVLFNYNTNDRLLCILRRKVNNNRLVMIPSLPRMPPTARYVAVGSKIYVLSCFSVLSIDCRSHTVQPISDIPEPMNMINVAEIIDGKIYVIGRCPCDDEESSGRGWRTRVSVLDTETQMWEPEMIKPCMEQGFMRDAVVLDDKIYIRYYASSFVYVPKENKWETDVMLNSEAWEHACVVDRVLYYYDTYVNILRAYDPKQRCWRVVNCLEELSFKTACMWSGGWNMVSYGGKLALFFRKDQYETTKIWCAEIALERRQGGDIWGKVQWCDVVLDDGDYYMKKCLDVTI